MAKNDPRKKKSIGAYYTPKKLLEQDEIVIQSETGSFLKKAFDWLVRGLTVNPPYNTGVETDASPQGDEKDES